MAATGEDTGLDTPTWPSDHGAAMDRSSRSPIGGHVPPPRLPIPQGRPMVKGAGRSSGSLSKGTDTQTVTPDSGIIAGGGERGKGPQRY